MRRSAMRSSSTMRLSVQPPADLRSPMIWRAGRRRAGSGIPATHCRTGSIADAAAERGP